MRVLVVYASRHGATEGIAERIATSLEGRSIDVTLRPADDAGDIAGYDAFVIGSAAYMFHWLKEATSFVRHNRSLLTSRPVWLFSSGPIGTDTVDKKGRDVRVASEPKEFAEFRDAIHPRGTRVFYGAYDPDGEPIGFMEQVTRFLPKAAREAMPKGDFRDWHDVQAWAGAIAEELTVVPVGA